MSQRVFHSRRRQDPCGNRVDFLGGTVFHSFSTGFCSGICTGFAVEEASPRGFFLDFNNTTPTINGYKN